MSEDIKQLPQWAELVPAYGRDFGSKADAIADWEAGKDWRYPAHGGYCSVRDQAVGRTVLLRYKRQTLVAEYTKT
jgi:hypothetical protein